MKELKSIRRNADTYKVGDKVRILCGPQKGKIATVEARSRIAYRVKPIDPNDEQWGLYCPEELVSLDCLEDPTNSFVYIRGSVQAAAEVCRELERRGGRNTHNVTGKDFSSWYFIDPYGNIACAAPNEWMRIHYTEIKLL